MTAAIWYLLLLGKALPCRQCRDVGAVRLPNGFGIAPKSSRHLNYAMSVEALACIWEDLGLIGNVPDGAFCQDICRRTMGCLGVQVQL